jgi:hypothetical protein
MPTLTETVAWGFVDWRKAAISWLACLLLSWRHAQFTHFGQHGPGELLEVPIFRHQLGSQVAVQLQIAGFQVADDAVPTSIGAGRTTLPGF